MKTHSTPLPTPSALALGALLALSLGPACDRADAAGSTAPGEKPRAGAPVTPTAEHATAPAPAPEHSPAPAANPAPNPKPAEPAVKAETPAGESPRAASGGPLVVERLVVTSGIQSREPIANPVLTTSGEPIYAFLELKNPSDTAESVLVTFERGDQSVGNVTLEIPAHAERWRTWARTQLIKTPGEWQAVVRGQDSGEVARTTFSIGS